MARKLKVTHRGETYERRTDRAYTHIVVSGVGPRHLRNSERDLAEWTARVETAREMGKLWGSWTLNEMEHVLTCMQQSHATLVVAAETGSQGFATWHQRLDLAQKEAAKRAGDDYFSNVEIVAVPA